MNGISVGGAVWLCDAAVVVAGRRGKTIKLVFTMRTQIEKYCFHLTVVVRSTRSENSPIKRRDEKRKTTRRHTFVVREDGKSNK